MPTLDRTRCDAAWVSLLLRLLIAVLLLVPGIDKWCTGGMSATAAHFQTMFKDTWLPGWLVTAQGQAVPVLEIVIPIWLLLGGRLRIAWIFTTVYMISLVFGMAVAKQYGVVANNSVYVLTCCAGLYLSGYDRFSIDGVLRPQPSDGT